MVQADCACAQKQQRHACATRCAALLIVTKLLTSFLGSYCDALILHLCWQSSKARVDAPYASCVLYASMLCVTFCQGELGLDDYLVKAT